MFTTKASALWGEVYERAGKNSADWAVDAFQITRNELNSAGLSSVKLTLNDFNLDNGKICDLAKGRRDKGAPIQVVGFQFYLQNDQYASEETYASMFSRCRSHGFEASVSEIAHGVDSDNASFQNHQRTSRTRL